MKLPNVLRALDAAKAAVGCASSPGRHELKRWIAKRPANGCLRGSAAGPSWGVVETCAPSIGVAVPRARYRRRRVGHVADYDCAQLDAGAEAMMVSPAPPSAMRRSLVCRPRRHGRDRNVISSPIRGHVCLDLKRPQQLANQVAGPVRRTHQSVVRMLFSLQQVVSQFVSGYSADAADNQSIAHMRGQRGKRVCRDLTCRQNGNHSDKRDKQHWRRAAARQEVDPTC